MWLTSVLLYKTAYMTNHFSYVNFKPVKISGHNRYKYKQFNGHNTHQRSVVRI